MPKPIMQLVGGTDSHSAPETTAAVLPSPTRRQNAMFGSWIGALVGVCSLFCGMLPTGYGVPTAWAICGGIIAALGANQWLDPVGKRVWDERFAGMSIGISIVFTLTAAAILTSPMFKAPLDSRLWAAAGPMFMAVVLAIAARMVLRRPD